MFDLQVYIRRPAKIKAVQMEEDFTLTTSQRVYYGYAGDYVIVDVIEYMLPKEIFEIIHQRERFDVQKSQDINVNDVAKGYIEMGNLNQEEDNLNGVQESYK